MKIFLSLLFSILFGNFLQTQNVGIGTTTPAEKLDVNGKVNITGQLKMANDAGSQGEFLMSGGAGQNPVWAGLGFTTVRRFNQSSSNQNFTIPAGVTKILIEGWSAGGYPFTDVNNIRYSGGSGGYIKGIIAVTPGSVFTIRVPLAQTFTVLTDTFKMEYNSSKLWLKNGDTSRGGYLISRTGIFDDIFNIDGEEGEALVTTYFQNSQSQYVKEMHFPNGGKAPLAGNGGGGQTVQQNMSTQDYYFIGNHKRAAFPGGGGYYRFTFTNASVYGLNAGASGVLFIYY